MNRLLAWFTVGCCLFIATSNGVVSETVQYDHLHLGQSIYNIIKSTYDGNFGIAPLGLGSILTAVNDQLTSWRQKPSDAGVWVFDSEYEEPLGTNQSIAKIVNSDFKDVKLRHSIECYVSDGSLKETTTKSSYFSVHFNIVPLDNVEELENRINDDIRNSTEGLIQRAIPPHTIFPGTYLIILDVWTFEGNFKTPFQESIFQYDFYKNGQNIGKIPFLHLCDEMKHVHSNQIHSTIVEIPYKDEDFSMIAIFPDEDNPIDGLTTKIYLPHVFRLLDKADKHKVLLRLPQVEFETSFTVKYPLLQAGLPEKEELHAQNFTNQPIRSDVRQTIYFSVNATAPITEQLTYSIWKSSPVLKFDRPFLIGVRYKELCLIIAEINDPTERESYSFQSWEADLTS